MAATARQVAARERYGMRSNGEELMAFQLRASGIVPPEREYRFGPPRRWRFDFAWPEHGVALEVEGGTWTGGRHGRGTGFAADCEKYNAAALLGWIVLRATTEQVEAGQALGWVTTALRLRGRDQ